MSLEVSSRLSKLLDLLCVDDRRCPARRLVSTEAFLGVESVPEWIAAENACHVACRYRCHSLTRPIRRTRNVRYDHRVPLLCESGGQCRLIFEDVEADSEVRVFTKMRHEVRFVEYRPTRCIDQDRVRFHELKASRVDKERRDRGVTDPAAMYGARHFVRSGGRLTLAFPEANPD